MDELEQAFSQSGISESNPVTEGLGQKSYSNELQKLRSRHHLIIRLHATGQLNGKEIAEIVDVTPQTVYNTLNSDLAKQKIAYLRRQAEGHTIDILKELQNLAPTAVAQLEDVLTDPGAKQKLRVKVAQDILDRAGYGKTQNINVNENRVTDADIAEIREKAKQNAEEVGVLTDAKVIDEDSSDGPRDS